MATATVALMAIVTACSTGPTEDATTAGGSTAAPATASPGTDAPGTVAPGTTSTEPATTTSVEPTTIAPTTTAAPTPPPTAPPLTTAVRAPRPLPPLEGRAAPPENLGWPTSSGVPNEGVWQPLGAEVGGAPAMYSTTLRTSPDGRNQAGAVWIDNTAIVAQLFPGGQQPGGNWATPPAIPVEAQGGLLAAFNSGFLIGEAQGGFYLEGREGVPLRGGTAGIHIDTSGAINVGALGRDFNVDGATAAVRQNLPLLVDGRVVAASATFRDNYAWGKTLGGGAAVWRSGLGIRDDGTLVYIGGPAMSARTLGDAFVMVGAVRALELDINPNWVTFNSYRFDPSTGRATGTKLLPIMSRSGDRYLTADDRDFFAIFAKP